MEKEMGVYRIVNDVNCKVYVGSSTNLHHREIEHFTYLKRGAHSNKHLQSAFDKYGAEHFYFEILDYASDTDDMIEKEKYWIDFYESNKREYGYNSRVVPTSNAGMTFGEETRSKLSKIQKGKKLTPEHCENISKGLKGRVFSEESKRKMSENSGNRGRVYSQEERKILSDNKKKMDYVKELIIKYDKYLQIKSLLEDGLFPTEISKIVGVDRSTVYKVKKGFYEIYYGGRTA